MRGSIIEFFADPVDLSNLFNLFDESGEYVYTARLSRVGEKNDQYNSAKPLLNSLVTHEKPAQSCVFVITTAGTSLLERQIKMNDGSGVKLKIDQNYNFDAIEILLGGAAGPTTLVTTTIRTTGETKVAKGLFKTFKNIVVKYSQKVGNNYYVMENAMKKLGNGWRLTAGIDYSSELDLQRRE